MDNLISEDEKKIRLCSWDILFQKYNELDNENVEFGLKDLDDINEGIKKISKNKKKMRQKQILNLEGGYNSDTDSVSTINYILDCKKISKKNANNKFNKHLFVIRKKKTEPLKRVNRPEEIHKHIEENFHLVDTKLINISDQFRKFKSEICIDQNLKKKKDSGRILESSTLIDISTGKVTVGKVLSENNDSTNLDSDTGSFIFKKSPYKAKQISNLDKNGNIEQLGDQNFDTNSTKQIDLKRVIIDSKAVEGNKNFNLEYKNNKIPSKTLQKQSLNSNLIKEQHDTIQNNSFCNESPDLKNKEITSKKGLTPDSSKKCYKDSKEDIKLHSKNVVKYLTFSSDEDLSFNETSFKRETSKIYAKFTKFKQKSAKESLNTNQNKISDLNTSKKHSVSKKYILESSDEEILIREKNSPTNLKKKSIKTSTLNYLEYSSVNNVHKNIKNDLQKIIPLSTNLDTENYLELKKVNEIEDINNCIKHNSISNLPKNKKPLIFSSQAVYNNESSDDEFIFKNCSLKTKSRNISDISKNIANKIEKQNKDTKILFDNDLANNITNKSKIDKNETYKEQSENIKVSPKRQVKIMDTETSDDEIFSFKPINEKTTKINSTTNLDFPDDRNSNKSQKTKEYLIKMDEEISLCKTKNFDGQNFDETMSLKPYLNDSENNLKNKQCDLSVRKMKTPIKEHLIYNSTRNRSNLSKNKGFDIELLNSESEVEISIHSVQNISKINDKDQKLNSENHVKNLNFSSNDKSLNIKNSTKLTNPNELNPDIKNLKFSTKNVEANMSKRYSQESSDEEILFINRKSPRKIENGKLQCDTLTNRSQNEHNSSEDEFIFKRCSRKSRSSNINNINKKNDAKIKTTFPTELESTTKILNNNSSNNVISDKIKTENYENNKEKCNDIKIILKYDEKKNLETSDDDIFNFEFDKEKNYSSNKAILGNSLVRVSQKTEKSQPRRVIKELNKENIYENNDEQSPIKTKVINKNSYNDDLDVYLTNQINVDFKPCLTENKKINNSFVTYDKNTLKQAKNFTDNIKDISKVYDSCDKKMVAYDEQENYELRKSIKKQDKIESFKSIDQKLLNVEEPNIFSNYKNVLKKPKHKIDYHIKTSKNFEDKCETESLVFKMPTNKNFQTRNTNIKNTKDYEIIQKISTENKCDNQLTTPKKILSPTEKNANNFVEPNLKTPIKKSIFEQSLICSTPVTNKKRKNIFDVSAILPEDENCDKENLENKQNTHLREFFVDKKVRRESKQPKKIRKVDLNFIKEENV